MQNAECRMQNGGVFCENDLKSVDSTHRNSEFCILNFALFRLINIISDNLQYYCVTSGTAVVSVGVVAGDWGILKPWILP